MSPGFTEIYPNAIFSQNHVPYERQNIFCYDPPLATSFQKYSRIYPGPQILALSNIVNIDTWSMFGGGIFDLFPINFLNFKYISIFYTQHTFIKSQHLSIHSNQAF